MLGWDLFLIYNKASDFSQGLFTPTKSIKHTADAVVEMKKKLFAGQTVYLEPVGYGKKNGGKRFSLRETAFAGWRTRNSGAVLRDKLMVFNENLSRPRKTPFLVAHFLDIIHTGIAAITATKAMNAYTRFIFHIEAIRPNNRGVTILVTPRARELMENTSS